MRRTHIIFPLIVCAYLGSAGFGFQTTPPGLNNFGNRVEGVILQNHSAEDLRVLGIHRSFDLFPHGSTLSVKFFVPPNVAPNDVSVVAVERQDFKHYLMQSTGHGWIANSWNTFTPWSTSDVIDGLAINPSNLAVVAKLGIPGATPLYLPVDVLTAGAAGGNNAYVFLFATSKDLQTLIVSVMDSNGHDTGMKVIKKCTLFVDCAVYAAHSTQAVTLDFSGKIEGKYFVKFTASMPGNSDTLSVTIPIYHRPD